MAFALVVASRAGMEATPRMWIPYALGAIAVRLVGARLPDRVGPHNIVAPAIALYAAGFLCMTTASSDAGFLVAALLCGISHGYCFPVIASQVVGRTPEALRGGAMALSIGIWEITAIFVQPAFGKLADRHGDTWLFLAAAGCCCLGVTLWLLLEMRVSAPQYPRSAPQSPALPS
jgi:MFS family permease